METQNFNFNKTIPTQAGRCVVELPVYLFREGDAYIVYCPSLDLNGCGNSAEEARQSFSTTVEMYIDHCVRKRTLVKDLRAHGWKVKSMRQRKLRAPEFDELAKTNETLRDILINREYHKFLNPVEI